MVCLSLPHGIRSSLRQKEIMIRLPMALLTIVIVTDPFATMRLHALPRSNLLVVKGLSVMLVISMSGKVHQFKRMIIGRTPSSGSTRVLLLETADEFAPYGGRAGRAGKAHEGVKMVSITRRAALHYSEITARDFENMGECPFSSGYYPIFVGEPKRVANVNENVAASAKVKRDMLDLWLVDTGCSHDLVSSTKVKLSGGEARRLEKAVIFQTANGDTPGTHVAPISFRELNETIEPYVLKETPSVISVGDRTMNKGCSFVWKAGCNPYLITPDEKVISFEVIRDIPTLGGILIFVNRAKRLTKTADLMRYLLARRLPPTKTLMWNALWSRVVKIHPVPLMSLRRTFQLRISERRLCL